MKSLLEVSVRILHSCGMQCGVDPIRDCLTVTERTKEEGDSFLTITLPTFCRGIEKSLDIGHLSPSLFPGFRFRKNKRLPQFLGGFVERVFGTDGVLLSSPDRSCIFAIRQICLAFKKIELPCSDTRKSLAEKAFLSCESELRSHVFDGPLYHTFKYVSRIIWASIVSGTDFADPFLELVPRHGPGNTADRFHGNEKFSFTSWPLRLDSVFPFTEFGVSSLRNFCDGGVSSVSFLSARDEIPVKVCFVPKTLKTPRVIAAEPVAMQFAQQSVSKYLIPRIETLSKYTSGSVNFSKQEVNQELACKGSIDGSLGTIDMSEASDRVSSILVRDMLTVCPRLRELVFACRSTRAKLPSGKLCHLRKFASMGSALCFPIEAMAFYCAIASIRLFRAQARLTPSSVYKYTRDVFVYGDDIIVPSHEAPLICKDLECFAFKVNSHKSFWTGKFRESCGKDWFDGYDVTPTYIRQPIPTDKTDAKGLVSWTSTANQFYFLGLWDVARFVRQHIDKICGELPSVPRTSQVIGWHSYSEALSFNGWDKDLQRPKLRCFVPIPVRRKSILDGDSALLKCFGLIGLDSISPQHLLVSVRYGNLALKRRWI